MCSHFPHCFHNSRQNADDSSPAEPQGYPTAGTLSQEEVAPFHICPVWFLLSFFSTDLTKGTIKYGLTVEDLIMTGINYLDTRSNFWRQQKPIYARERDRKLMQEKWLRDRKRRPSQTARYILKSLEDIDMCGWWSQRGGVFPRWGGSNREA